MAHNANLRNKIDLLLAELNTEQRWAATSLHGPLLVLAGAGTGKTKVITTRIAHMIASGIDASSIVAVSFTNKAAREMKERLAQFVGEHFAKRVTLSTFHSFALSIIRRHPHAVGLGNKFSIADEGESKALLRETLKDLNLEDIVSLPLAIERMSQFKDRLYTDIDFDKSGALVDKAIMKSLFEGYNRRLRLYNLVDFDDIVYLAAILVKSNESIRAELQLIHQYLMIDEFQDTSFSQFELIRLLGEKSRRVCVVGDDDQSIYAWRGARPEVIADFLTVFPEAQKVTLEQNYRCSPNILAGANAVIAENTQRMGKTLWSKQPNDYLIQIHAAENERDEALFVARTLEDLSKAHGFNYDQAAILVRSNAQTVMLEQVFAERKIPYHVHGGTKFFDRKEVRDLFGYLKLAHNPSDLNALFRVINLPSRGIGVGTLEKLKEAFEHRRHADSSANVHHVLHDMARHHTGILNFFTSWTERSAEFNSSNSQQDVANALRNCFESTGLKHDIVSSSPNMQAANARIELVERVFDVITKLELENGSLESIVDALHLDEPRFEKGKDTRGKVQLMSMHSSKGLEFPLVFLIGIEDNMIPHERAMKEGLGGEQEERRLFYVAMTRAKSRLIISHCGHRRKGRNQNRGVSPTDPQPSRFLTAIPTELLHMTETDPGAEEARRMDSAKRLFDMFR